jgi:hypothetical protein
MSDDPVITPLAWPPGPLPTSRTDATPMTGTHPADHNQVNLAVNDIVTKLTATDAGISGMRAVQTWAPSWTVGGVGVSNAYLTYALWVNLGGIRVGAARYVYSTGQPGPASPGGFLIGNGFWTPTLAVQGGFHFYEAGVNSHTGFTQRFDAATLCFGTNGVGNIFGVSPSVVPSPGDILQFYVISWEP